MFRETKQLHPRSHMELGGFSHPVNGGSGHITYATPSSAPHLDPSYDSWYALLGCQRTTGEPE